MHFEDVPSLSKKEWEPKTTSDTWRHECKTFSKENFIWIRGSIFMYLFLSLMKLASLSKAKLWAQYLNDKVLRKQNIYFQSKSKFKNVSRSIQQMSQSSTVTIHEYKCYDDSFMTFSMYPQRLRAKRECYETWFIFRRKKFTSFRLLCL